MKFIASLALMVSPLSVQAFSSADADAAVDAFNNAFYVLNDGKGYYKSDTVKASPASMTRMGEIG